jgi:hypothetical protein
MDTIPCSNPAKTGRVLILIIWVAAVAFVSAAMPRAQACEVGDEADAVAEGLVHDDDAADRATTPMSCKLLVPGPHLQVTPPRKPTRADIERANEIRASVRQALGKYGTIA